MSKDTKPERGDDGGGVRWVRCEISVSCAAALDCQTEAVSDFHRRSISSRHDDDGDDGANLPS